MHINNIINVLLSQYSGEAKNSFTAMHLEELQRDDGDNEEDLDLLRRQAMHLWTGEYLILD